MASHHVAGQTGATQPPMQGRPVPPSHHPRRPPAHRSVSLLHKSRPATSSSRKNRSDSSSDSQQPNQQRGSDGKSTGSPSSLLPLARDSSGESSNADRWFEKSNNDVRDNSASFADNDPPFFMRNSSSSGTPPDALRLSRQFAAPNNGALSLPLRTGLLQLGTDGSSTEDFRSVIDDLTIENKKLKRRLKRYEKLHDAHLRDEKLFEVRIHGLPAEKKRELEETLRKFTASLGTNGFHPNGYEGLLPSLNKATSSSTSNHHTDSAYASMSASGQGSSAQSGNDTMYRSRHPSAAARHQNIHSYLHHIPEALLLHPNPSTMSERSKKKLVVRRLEQIFAGKGAAAGTHQHPIQQQEISQIAARESRLAFEAKGERARQEGSREAPIMRQETEDPADPSVAKQDGNTTPQTREKSTNSKHPQHASAVAVDQHGNLEQRPTRPLDVDPHRAQVPAENIRYFRHLGFSPLDMDAAAQVEEGHGWIYLNLLINMAQLHTINVTADFVRKALSESHSALELSHDGRKVRWKGGRPATTTSSSGGGSSNDHAGMDTPDDQSPRKRPRLMHRESSRLQTIKQGNTSTKGQENNKLVYTPLFFHKSSTESDSSSEDEEEDSMTSPFPVAPAGDSSGMTSSGMRTTSTKKAKRLEDGPIIFYNNARFCTDLSGDRKPMANNAPYSTKINSIPVGKPLNLGPRPIIEKRGPLADAFELPEPMDLSDNPIPASMELAFPPSSETSASSKPPTKLNEMEVSGIGGVWPSDHFALTVESRLTRREKPAGVSKARVHRPHSHLLHPRFQRILHGAGPDAQAPTAVHDRKIIALHMKDLPPSMLPPALGFMSLDDSNGDDESDVDDEASASPDSPVPFPPSAAPQPVDLHYAPSDEEDEEDDEDDDEDDDDDESSGSLDLLAAAREADPEAIRQKEREYDASIAERLAEEIPAGSSAATAGGGSGFASPASNMNREEYQRLVKEVRGRHGTLKRAQTSDSIEVQAMQESSDEEDEEMSDIAS